MDFLSSIAQLASRDHEVRKQAINALLTAGYQDPQESRTFQILGRTPGVVYDQNELKKDIQRYPDFYLVYLRAAYPTAQAEDHAHADVTMLLEGLVKSTVKWDILAKLSCYYTWKGDWLEALDYATAAVLLGVPSQGPGDMVQVLVLLRGVFDQVGLHTDANMAKVVKAGYSLGGNEATAVEKAVEALAGRYEAEVRWAADTVRAKLSNAFQKKSRR